MGQLPAINDRKYDLIFKIAKNFYDHGVAQGLTGFNPPSLNDREPDLLKKVAYYTARIDDAS